MPHGASPGERRGGRPKGGLNKSTVAKDAAFRRAMSLAFAELGADALDTIMPAELMLVAMRTMAKIGLHTAALSIADKAAPYYNAKLAPLIVEPPAEPEEAKAKRLHGAASGAAIGRVTSAPGRRCCRTRGPSHPSWRAHLHASANQRDQNRLSRNRF
jgi:hypothetical protein